MSDKEAKTGQSQRKHVRYPVSDDCRLKAALRIQSSDATTAAKDWPGMLVDASAAGAHVQISLGAIAYKNDSCVLKLSHGTVKTEIRGTLVHYVCSTRYSVCGLRFDHATNQGYEPILKALMAGGSLKTGES